LYNGSQKIKIPALKPQPAPQPVSQPQPKTVPQPQTSPASQPAPVQRLNADEQRMLDLLLYGKKTGGRLFNNFPPFF